MTVTIILFDLVLSMKHFNSFLLVGIWLELILKKYETGRISVSNLAVQLKDPHGFQKSLTMSTKAGVGCLYH